MIQKILAITLLTFLLNSQLIYGQNKQISGTVTLSYNNKIAEGVTINVEGSTINTLTDASGKYTLNIPQSATTLIFSFIGTKTVRQNINGRSIINISLVDDINELDNVVITALGVKGERDKFASSVTSLKGNTIAKSGETGVLNGLSGKVSGVIVSRNGGDPGAGSYIQIRGQNTISGNAQPLFIIDGIPVSNSSDNIGAAKSNGIIQQSRINDINPDDIERVEVLKGASAAAVWGSRAANGVIVITTKKGKNTGGKIDISFKSTVSFDQVNKSHKLQTRYGQGSDGIYNQSNRASFGDIISDRLGGEDQYITNPTAAGYQGYVTLADGSLRYTIAAGNSANPHGGKRDTSTFDHTKDAFQTGYFVDNSFNISGGNEKSTFALSFGNLNQDGVVRSASDYERKTVRLNVTNKLTNWFTATANIGYTKINSNRVQEGDNADGILLSSLRTPADFNNNFYNGTYTDPSGQLFPNAHVSYRNPLGKDLNTIYANPNWNITNNYNSSEVDRIVGSLQLDLTPVDWLTTTARVGIDNYNDNRLERFARNSANFPRGLLSKNWVTEKQFNTDLFVIAKKTISADFNGSLLLGFNYNSRRRESLTGSITNFIIPTAPDILTNAISTNLSASNFNSLNVTYGFYAQADFEAYDMLFLTLTGRNEAASTFGNKTKNNFFFPSAALAWQFSKLELFNDQSLFNFGKLRLTWGQVGIQPQPYQNFNNFNAANYIDGFSSGLSGISAIYNGGYVQSTIAGNDSLRPEIKTETEVGVDFRFFKNRVSFAATAYFNKTKDVILPISLPASTGFTTYNSNAAELENKGIELEMDLDVIKINDFKWNISANFSTNKNKVISLAGANSYSLPDSFIANASLVVGQPFGVFLSTDFLKNDSGSYVLDTNGFPQAGTGVEVIGNPNPEWRAGIGSTFSYKDFALFMLFDTVQGNDIFNGTRGSLYAFGTHADVGNTATAPTGGIKDVSGKTIAAGTTFQGEITDFGAGPVALNQAWYQGRGSASNTASYKQFIEDGSASRLREVTLSYSLKNVKFFKSNQLSKINFSLTGRNLILWTKYSGTDPESNVTGAGLARGQDWFTNPSTKSLLFTVLVKY
ncbi:TonB-linked outer membrane protein, SusC/RagA family [Flavobacterium segetis]|uniref:TonB-linked outer membrane protein, SusC/RagA family n=1 Tax=Flavobacterium segetis TaxID=271157 RepID=A0A1M5J3W9_9FLAO|nr:SusC/RagA family TonB-linked outer membrane protein [Flavobacterium segetis]SHG35055.1 TonB-linked outer membrane protein, SusC/RagA family [Flavobacterium segetis]